MLGKREFTRDQGYYIKSRLLKKVEVLYGIELPLLDEKGFLDNLAACSKDLAAGCKIQDNRKIGWSSLVRIARRHGFVREKGKIIVVGRT